MPDDTTLYVAEYSFMLQPSIINKWEVVTGFPRSWKSHGKWLVMEKSWKSHGKLLVMEKSWNSVGHGKSHGKPKFGQIYFVDFVELALKEFLNVYMRVHMSFCKVNLTSEQSTGLTIQGSRYNECAVRDRMKHTCLEFHWLPMENLCRHWSDYKNYDNANRRRSFLWKNTDLTTLN